MFATLLGCCASYSQSRSEELPQYTAYQTTELITIDGVLDEIAWHSAPVVGKFVFPWWVTGEREQTEARILWDKTYLYVSYIATDKHISAVLTERDDPVSKDDAVEVFIAPDSSNVRNYFNFEFNALGTILDRSPLIKRSSSWNAEGLKVGISIDGTLNDETDVDSRWTTELAIPFQTFAGFAPALPPHDGDAWRLNLYRIGGEINGQFSVWSDTQTEKPQYHVPERFGIVYFSVVEATSLGKPLGEKP